MTASDRRQRATKLLQPGGHPHMSSPLRGLRHFRTECTVGVTRVPGAQRRPGRAIVPTNAGVETISRQIAEAKAKYPVGFTKPQPGCEWEVTTGQKVPEARGGAIVELVLTQAEAAQDTSAVAPTLQFLEGASQQVAPRRQNALPVSEQRLLEAFEGRSDSAARQGLRVWFSPTVSPRIGRGPLDSRRRTTA